MAHPRKKPTASSRPQGSGPISPAVPAAKVVPLGAHQGELPQAESMLPAWTCGHCEVPNAGQERRCHACGATLPVIALFTARTFYRPDGCSIRLNWEVFEAESIRLEPGSTDLPPKGYIDLNPDLEPAREFTLYAHNAAGSSSLHAQVREVPPRIRQFTATDTTLQLGYPVIFAWEVENAAHITITPALGDVSHTSFIEAFIEASGSCTLTATNPLGSVTAEIYLTLPAPQIQAFHANTEYIRLGEPVLLFWEATNAARTWIEDDHGQTFEPETPGSCSLYPDRTTTYTLWVENATGRCQRHLRVTLPAPRIRSFGADTPVSTEGEAITLHWQVEHAYAVRLDPDHGPVPVTGHLKVKPRQPRTTYTLTALGHSGEAEATFEVLRFPMPLDESIFATPDLSDSPMERPQKTANTLTDLEAMEKTLKDQTQAQFRDLDIQKAQQRQLTDDLLTLERAHVRQEIRRAIGRLKAKLFGKI